MSSENSTALPESREDAIIRVTTYHRNDYDHFGIHFGEKHHSPVLSSIASPFSSVPTGGCGTIGGLPVEVLQEICSLLDVQSCVKFRQVNRWARQVVSGMPQYRAVATHALECLCALLQTGIGSACSFTDVYDLLRTSTCYRCGRQFGTHVYLPGMRRYCRDCLDSATNNDLCITNALTFERLSGRNIDSLDKPILKFRSLTGRYNSHQKYIYVRKRMVMVNLRQAMDALRSVSQSNEVALARRYSDMKTASYMPWVASVTMPHYDLATFTTMSGLACKGCARWADRLRGADGLRRLQLFQGHTMNKTYTRAQFLYHFQYCAQAQTLWEASQKGTLSTEYLVSTFVRNGGFAVNGNPFKYL